MLEAMNLLIIPGSTRRASLNRQLARAAERLATAADLEPTVLEFSVFDVPLYDADLEASGTPADVLTLKALFAAAPGWLVVSPEYNGSYPPLLKNVFDWVSSPVRGHPLWADGTRATRGKVVGVLSASPGAVGGLRAHTPLLHLLWTLGCWVSPVAWAVGRAHEAFDAHGQLREPDAAAVRGVIESVAHAMLGLGSSEAAPGSSTAGGGSSEPAGGSATGAASSAP